MFGQTAHTHEAPRFRDVTVRLADPGDSHALLRLAALDSASVPSGPLVLAETGGELVAATPVRGGCTIADPFRHTAALVEMLELRAAQLRRELPGGGPGALRSRLGGLVGDSRPLPYLP